MNFWSDNRFTNVICSFILIGNFIWLCYSDDSLYYSPLITIFYFDFLILWTWVLTGKFFQKSTERADEDKKTKEKSKEIAVGIIGLFLGIIALGCYIDKQSHIKRCKELARRQPTKAEIKEMLK